MPPEPWLYAGVALLSMFHLALLLYAFRSRLPWRRGRDAPAGSGPRTYGDEADPPDADATLEPDEGTVRCRQCGAENEREYRFCRRCVAELPGPTLGGTGAPTPNSRRMF